MIRKEIAMARNFYIDNINDTDKLNEISILLNSMEEVSRIKISKTEISFIVSIQRMFMRF